MLNLNEFYFSKLKKNAILAAPLFLSMSSFSVSGDGEIMVADPFFGFGFGSASSSSSAEDNSVQVLQQVSSASQQSSHQTANTLNNPSPQQNVHYAKKSITLRPSQTGKKKSAEKSGQYHAIYMNGDTSQKLVGIQNSIISDYATVKGLTPVYTTTDLENQFCVKEISSDGVNLKVGARLNPKRLPQPLHSSLDVLNDNNKPESENIEQKEIIEAQYKTEQDNIVPTKGAIYGNSLVYEVGYAAGYSGGQLFENGGMLATNKTHVTLLSGMSSSFEKLMEKPQECLVNFEHKQSHIVYKNFDDFIEKMVEASDECLRDYVDKSATNDRLVSELKQILSPIVDVLLDFTLDNVPGLKSDEVRDYITTYLFTKEFIASALKPNTVNRDKRNRKKEMIKGSIDINVISRLNKRYSNSNDIDQKVILNLLDATPTDGLTFQIH